MSHPLLVSDLGFLVLLGVVKPRCDLSCEVFVQYKLAKRTTKRAQYTEYIPGCEVEKRKRKRRILFVRDESLRQQQVQQQQQQQQTTKQQNNNNIHMESVQQADSFPFFFSLPNPIFQFAASVLHPFGLPNS